VPVSSVATTRFSDQPIGTLAAIEFIAVLQALARLGFDSDAVLTRSRIPPEALSEPFTRISAAEEHALWEAAELVTGDPAVGLRVGVEHCRHGARNLVEYLFVHSPTLRQALPAVQAVVPLVDDLGHVDVIEEGDRVRVGIRRDGIPRARGYVECLCAAAFTFYTDHVEGFRLAEVCLTYPRPSVVEPYRDLFGMRPRFEAVQNQLAFDRCFLDVPFKGADPQIGRLLQDHARHLLRELPAQDAFVDAARRALARALEAGEASPERVARALGTSVRTLRRKLSTRGTSYQRLLDELRCASACHHLKHSDDSIDRVAERVGFASRAAFQRAFRRYTGKSPSEYRASG
jgi:AraC-like DNA-binding protein